MKKFSIILLVALFALNIFGQTIKRSSSGVVLTNRAQSEISQVVSDEEYKVYAVALKYAMNSRNDKGIPIIKAQTDIDKDSKKINWLADWGFLEKMKPETMPDFLIKNEGSATLENKFPSAFDYQFTTDEQLKKDFEFKYDDDMNWELFQKKYPNNDSIYTLSRVGFSQDSKEALVFVTFWCFYTCGEGNYYLMKKENDEWKIVDGIRTWIS